MRVADVLPPVYLAGVLEGEFLPRWLLTLAVWLASPQCDYEEVQTVRCDVIAWSLACERQCHHAAGRTVCVCLCVCPSALQWYQGWKAVFPTVLLSDAAVRSCFVEALRLIHEVVSCDSDAESAKVARGAVTRLRAAQETQPRGYVDVLKARMKSRPRDVGDVARMSAVSSGGSGHASSDAHVTGGRTSQLSFTDVVGYLADKRGLAIIPNDKRGTHEGKKLLQIGTVTFYIFADVVYMESVKDKVSTFNPVPLETLFASAQAV